MMEEQRERRYQPVMKKKLRYGRFILTLFVLALLAIGAYSFFQFQAGKQLAQEAGLIEPDTTFVGDTQSGGIENFLLLGVDSRGEEQSRTDTMMLVSWNKDTDEVKLISFMRDIYATIPGYQNYKLNTAYYLGGAQLAKDTISSMFDVEIHHYAVIDFKSFESLIDILAPNGVTIDVEKDMSEKIGVTLTQGTHQLNGQELLGYARFRADHEGDFGRVARQQKVIEALKNELLSVGNMKHIPKLVGATQGYVITDVSSAEQLTKVMQLATSGASIDKLTIPAEGTYDDDRISGIGSVLAIDQVANQQAIKAFLNTP